MTTPTATTPAVRSNLEAEECVLGIALYDRNAVPGLVADLTPADFYRPAHAAAFAAVVELYQAGSAVDAVMVADVMRREGRLDDIGGAARLVELAFNVPSALHAQHYASIIRREASARALARALSDGAESLALQVDPLTVAEDVAEKIRQLDSGGTLPARYWRSADEYLAQEKAELGSVLVPGLLNRRTRVIVLATEKSGKSVILREWAVCMAAGLHPFTFRPIEPVRVLLVDAENDDDELEGLSPLIELAERLAPGSPRPALFSAPYGMDLRSRRDRSELEAVLEDFHPQVIIGGPIYKLLEQADNTSDPRHAERLQRIFDDIRKRWGPALMLEHHAPSAVPGKQREIRSLGGQRWAAWPEVTVALHSRDNHGTPSLDVRYPHPPRGRFRWPKRFDRGTRPGEWPWVPVWAKAEGRPSDEPPPGFFEGREDAPF